jgi:translation initiation factor 2B subunit (eIF-2B alpha/beta/delta family)
LESDLLRSKDDQSKRCADYEKIIQEHSIALGEYKKTTKSLENEKSVLSAAIEARDCKLTNLEKMKKQIKNFEREVEDYRQLKIEMVRLFVNLSLKSKATVKIGNKEF